MKIFAIGCNFFHDNIYFVALFSNAVNNNKSTRESPLTCYVSSPHLHSRICICHCWQQQTFLQRSCHIEVGRTTPPHTSLRDLEAEGSAPPCKVWFALWQ